jgi:hypothetical protein
MVRDIRELTDSPEAYAAELRRRWSPSARSCMTRVDDRLTTVGSYLFRTP